MKNLTINISETDFIKYGFQQETLSFDELISKIKNQLTKSSAKKYRFEDTPAFNLWQDRDDMKNVENYVENLRKPRQPNVY
jgi:hypothetical protein